jgi:hypothetical protein
LLLELAAGNNKYWQGFLDNMFRDSEIWNEEKEKEYRLRLEILLKGKQFPLESPFLTQREGIKPRYFHYPYDFPMENMYRQTYLNNEFTLALYKEWEKDPHFLTYVIYNYLENYVFLGNNNFDSDYIFCKDNPELYNKYLTLDLSPFFLYKEQCLFVAEDLQNKFKDYSDRKFLYNRWLQIFIENLKVISYTFPKEKNKKCYGQVAFFFLIISPFWPFFSLFFYDFILYLVFGKYGFLGLILILYSLCKTLKDLEKYTFKSIFFETLNFCKEKFKILVTSFLLTQIHPFFKFIFNTSFKNGLQKLFSMFPLISMNDSNSQIILQKRKFYNQIKMALVGQYSNNPLILKNIFEKNKEKFFKEIGLTLQEVRKENSKNLNHDFLKNFRHIFFKDKIKKNSFEEEILFNRLKKIYFNSTGKILQVPKDWFFKFMETDPSQNKILNPDVLSALLLKEAKKN